MVWTIEIPLPNPEFWVWVAYGIVVLSASSFLWRYARGSKAEAEKLLRRQLSSVCHLFRLDIKIVFIALAVAAMLTPIELFLRRGGWFGFSYTLSWPWVGLSLVEMFVLWVLSPIVEEFWYRGFILRYLRGKLGLVIALAVTTLLFVLAHNLTLGLGPISGFLFCVDSLPSL